MKKRIAAFALIVALLSLLFASCGPSDRQDRGGPMADSTVPASQAETRRANAEAKAKNGRIEAFYTDAVPESLSSYTIAKYADDASATDSLSSLCSDSDTIVSIPILGTYLEKTSLFVCVFKKQGELIGTKALAADPNGNVTGELCTLLGETAGTPLADAYCFSVISACLSSYPSFEIEGIVYQDSGYSTIYPVGKNPGDESVRYYENGLKDFRLTDPFPTIEEGRVAFCAYWEFRTSVLSSIRIFEWANYDRYPYINQYRYQDVYSSGATAESYQYLFDFDWYLLIPLLNAEGKEGECALYLLYQKDNLIAETVLQMGSGNVVRVAKEHVSDKDPLSGKYIGLTGIDYAVACDRLLPENDANVKGVGFDGETFFVVYR